MKKQQIKAFTLVELIIVITILAILATIGFMSFQSYTADARDGKRKRDLTQLSRGLEIYQANNSVLPDPDSQTVTIMSGTSLTISTQGYAGSSVLQKLRATDMKDASDNNYYTYAVNGDKTKYQLLSMLEVNTVLANTNNILNEAYAVDYNSRYTYTKGNKVGIFFSGITNTPLQETMSGNLDLTTGVNATKVFKVMFANSISNSGTITATGTNLPSIIQIETNTVKNSNSGISPIPSPGCIFEASMVNDTNIMILGTGNYGMYGIGGLTTFKSPTRSLNMRTNVSSYTTNGYTYTLGKKLDNKIYNYVSGGNTYVIDGLYEICRN